MTKNTVLRETELHKISVGRSLLVAMWKEMYNHVLWTQKIKPSEDRSIHLKLLKGTWDFLLAYKEVKSGINLSTRFILCCWNSSLPAKNPAGTDLFPSYPSLQMSGQETPLNSYLILV